jgi:hypothetical protein
MKKIVLLFSLYILTLQLNAQDVSKLGKGQPLRISGRLSLVSNIYQASGEARRSPFSWSARGNMTLKLYGITMPFSFGLRNQQFSYGTPFNVYGVSPYYKWVKLHLGFRSMNFSPYTLSGKNFFGGGLELTPGKFRFAAMYGKFRNLLAQRDTAVVGATILPSYERSAYGAKIGTGNAYHSIDLMFLKVKDDENNIVNSDFAREVPEDAPQDNIVLGMNAKLTFFRRLSLQVNGAASAFTSNQNARTLNVLEDVRATFKDIIDANLSTRWGFAGDALLNFNLQNANFGLQYKRIDPFFNSLGINFIQKDLENYTANTSFSLFQRKLRLQGNFGLQRNNLEGFRSVGTQRTIGGGNLTFVPDRSWMVSIRHSNYQRENMEGILELNDTLRLVSVTKLTTINLRHKIFQKDNTLSIGASANMQSVQDQSEVESLQSEIGNMGASFSFGIQNREIGWNLTTTATYNQFQVDGLFRKRYGMSVRITRKLWQDRLQLRLAGNYRLNKNGEAADTYSFSGRLGLNWRVSGSHSLNVQGAYLQRNLSERSLREFRGSIGYNFSF